jgi:hypothetical protein
MLEKNERLTEMDGRHQALMHIIEERAVAYADDPIGQSGLYHLTYRIRGNREYPVLVEDYQRDVRELRELLKIERQAAIETGQVGKQREKTEKERARAGEVMRRIESGRQYAAKKQEEREAKMRGAS